LLPQRCEQQAGRAACQCEQHAFGQHVPGQAPTACPERAAHGQLASAARRAREQEIGHVGACDQQHEPDCPEQNQQGRPHVAHECLAQPERRCGRARIGVGIARCQQARDGCHLRGCLVDRDSGREPRDHVQVVRPALRRQIVFRESERRPEFGAGRVFEAGRHDADHGKLPAVEEHRAPEDFGVRAKVALPQTMAQQDDTFLAGYGVRLRDRTAKHRGRAQHREEARGHDRTGDPPRIADAGQSGGGAGVSSHLLEHRILAPPVHEVRRRRRAPRTGAAVIHLHESLRLRKGQRLQQHGVHDAENGGVRADADRERQHRDNREARVPPQRAYGIAQVVQ
jgi:hypothetical protein